MAKRKICPQCGETGTLREILYGLLAGPPDESKYMVGGCSRLLGQDFDVGCAECGWKGFSTRAKEKGFEELDSWIAEHKTKQK